jgi:hypothetical protein
MKRRVSQYEPEVQCSNKRVKVNDEEDKMDLDKEMHFEPPTGLFAFHNYNYCLSSPYTI